MRFSNTQKRELSREIDETINGLVTPQGEDGPRLNAVMAGVTDAKETLSLNANGVLNVNEGDKRVGVDSMVPFYSCTKSMTAIAALQLYEQGKIDLDVPAKTYLAEIGDIGVVRSGQVNEDDGTYITPPSRPKTEITMRHLLTHTAGFLYPFINEEYTLLMLRDPSVDAVNPKPSFFTNNHMPLIGEPGEQWLYGFSSDWIGLIVQRVSGVKLSEYLKKNLFEKAGMSSCTFQLKDTSNYVKMHKEDGNGKLRAMRKQGVNLEPEIDMGGQGCFGTVGDYLKLMRVWLNYGTSPDTGNQILRPETVKYAIQNHLSGEVYVNFDQVTTPIVPEGSPPDGFTLAGCAYTSNDLSTGRPKGALYWSGLGNLFYWMDFENKIAGFWATHLFPFIHEVSGLGYLEFEKKTYQVLRPNQVSAKI